MDNFSLQTSLRDLAFILFKRKWSVLIIISAAMISAVVWLWFIRDDQYEVSAKVLVKIGYEQSSSPTVFGERPSILGQRSQDVNSEIDILQSTDLIENIVDHFRLDRPLQQPVPEGVVPRTRYEVKKIIREIKDLLEELLIRLGLKERLTPREKAIFMIQKGLSISAARDSNIIIAKLKFPMRQGASTILNTLLDFYQSFRLKAFQDPGIVQFLSTQVGDSQRKLDDAEEELRSFEMVSNIISIEPQEEVLLRQIADAKSTLAEAEIAFNEASYKVTRLEKELKAEEPNFARLGSFSKDSFPERLVFELSVLQKERERLRMSYLDSSVQIQNNRDQFKSILSLLTSNLHSVLAERKATYESRKKILFELQDKLDALHNKVKGWKELKRNVQVLEDEYIAFRKKLKEGSSTSAMEHSKIGNVAVVQHAMDPLMPSGMRKLTLLGLSSFFALFAALVWVSLAEFFDHNVYAADALEKHIHVPVIATVPVKKDSIPQNNPALSSITEGETETEESLKKAAMYVANNVYEKRLNTFLFSSSRSGEGTSTVVLHIARQLKRNFGLTPLIIEANCQRPSFHSVLALDSNKTVSKIVSGKASVKDCIQQVQGLLILPAGSEPCASGMSFEWTSLLKRVLEEIQGFDVLLIDSPPVMEKSDVIAAGKIVPNLILIVESGRARFQVLDRVKKDLATENINIVGAILTKQKRFIPKWIYTWLS